MTRAFEDIEEIYVFPLKSVTRPPQSVYHISGVKDCLNCVQVHVPGTDLRIQVQPGFGRLVKAAAPRTLEA